MQQIKACIAKIEREIQTLKRSVPLIGELDQDGDLIISEKETLNEAVVRQSKINCLLEKKRKLEKQMEEKRKGDMLNGCKTVKV